MKTFEAILFWILVIGFPLIVATLNGLVTYMIPDFRSLTFSFITGGLAGMISGYLIADRQIKQKFMSNNKIS